MENEKKIFKKLLTDENYKPEFNKILGRPLQNVIMKNNETSAELNEEGNELFENDQHNAEEHEIIFQTFCASIARAVPESEELARGYGYRSAFLFHIEKYTECVRDIDRALKITAEDNFKVKLLCGKSQALKNLGMSRYSKVLDKAKKVLQGIPKSDKERQSSVQTIQKTEKVINMIDKVSINLQMDKDECEEASNIFDAVTVKYNEKYQRYLVAKRDMQPGEILFEEKLYASFLIVRKRHTNCNHCLRVCWTLIPCESCNWAMYCSEDCKNEASNSYHKIECHLIPKILCRFKENESILIESQLPIRLLLKGIEEAGSIVNLKKQLKSIDSELKKISNEIAGEYFTENMENNFTSVYLLKHHTHGNSNQDPVIVMVAIKLIRALFAQNKQFTEVQDVLKDEYAVFLGSLFIKLWKIKNANSSIIFKPTDVCDHTDAVEDVHKNNYCNATGCGLPVVSSLINHSCIPNVAKIVTDNQKIIIFALQPIKEGSQIFDCYLVPFYSQAKRERIDDLQQYKFHCECAACKNDFSAYNFSEMNEALAKVLIKIEKDEALNKKILDIKELIFTKDTIDIRYFGEIRRDLRDCIMKILEHDPPHSKAACKLYIMLQGLFMRVFSISKMEFFDCVNDESSV